MKLLSTMSKNFALPKKLETGLKKHEPVDILALLIVALRTSVKPSCTTSTSLRLPKKSRTELEKSLPIDILALPIVVLVFARDRDFPKSVAVSPTGA